MARCHQGLQDALFWALGPDKKFSRRKGIWSCRCNSLVTALQHRSHQLVGCDAYSPVGDEAVSVVGANGGCGVVVDPVRINRLVGGSSEE